jgi:hypothetical protein
MLLRQRVKFASRDQPKKLANNCARVAQGLVPRCAAMVSRKSHCITTPANQAALLHLLWDSSDSDPNSVRASAVAAQRLDRRERHVRRFVSGGGWRRRRPWATSIVEAHPSAVRRGVASWFLRCQRSIGLQNEDLPSWANANRPAYYRALLLHQFSASLERRRGGCLALGLGGASSHHGERSEEKGRSHLCLRGRTRASLQTEI